MRIEKNADGSYTLTCCPEQLRNIGKALRVVAVCSSPEMDRINKIADHLQWEIEQELRKWGDFESENECIGCPALLDEGEPRCVNK